MLGWQRFGVQIEDNSDRLSNAFAIDACIRAFYPVGDKVCSYHSPVNKHVQLNESIIASILKVGGFVVFDCEIKTREVSSPPLWLRSQAHDVSLNQGTIIRMLKRYSAFVTLRDDLIRTFPRLRPLIPPLPPKSSLGKRILYSPSLTA